MRVALVALLTGFLLVPSVARADSTADITIDFSDDCTSYEATSTKDISHIEETLAEGGVQPKINNPAKANETYTGTAPEGDHFVKVKVKSGTSVAEETCTPTDPGPEPGNCEDEADNDGDDLIDADDPDCQEEGCIVEDVNTCDEDTDNSGPEPGNCEDEADNEPDGFTDADDPDCQEEGCIVEDVNTCDEDTDNSLEPASVCVAPEDRGLLADLTSALGLGEDTLGAIAWDVIGQAIEDAIELGVFEDPQADGPLSSVLYDLADGTELEIVFNEAGCIVDLLIHPDLLGLDLDIDV